MQRIKFGATVRGGAIRVSFMVLSDVDPCRFASMDLDAKEVEQLVLALRQKAAVSGDKYLLVYDNDGDICLAVRNQYDEEFSTIWRFGEQDVLRLQGVLAKYIPKGK